MHLKPTAPILTILFCAILLIVAPSAQAFDPADVTGVWVTGEGKAHVRLETCGANLCGTIVWLAEPNDPDTGAPKTDKKNPDTSLRTRPILGLRLLDMRPDPTTGGWRGTVYNGQDGNTYDATLRQSAEDKLDLQGCVLFRLLCKAQAWTRFADEE